MCSQRFQCAAIIVEFRDHPSLTFAMKNAWTHLGKNWKFYIITIPENVEFATAAACHAFPDVHFSQKSNFKGAQLSRNSQPAHNIVLNLQSTAMGDFQIEFGRGKFLLR